MCEILVCDGLKAAQTPSSRSLELTKRRCSQRACIIYVTCHVSMSLRTPACFNHMLDQRLFLPPGCANQPGDT